MLELSQILEDVLTVPVEAQIKHNGQFGNKPKSVKLFSSGKFDQVHDIVNSGSLSSATTLISPFTTKKSVN